MGILVDLLTLPVLGGPRLVHWLATTVVEQAERESLDEGRVRGQLLEVQERYEAGEVTEEEYYGQEKALLDTLKAIREITGQRTAGGSR